MGNYKMTKFEAILRLSEIKGAILACESVAVPHSMIEELIDDLQNDEECETTVGHCLGCGGFYD